MSIDARIEAAELAAFDPIDEVLADLLAVALDKRRRLPMHVRLPAAMRDVRLAFEQETERAALKAVVWQPKRPARPMVARSLERVREALKVRPIVAAVAAAHGLTERHLRGTYRIASVCRARDEAAWLLRHTVNVAGSPISFPMIGLALGGRDHATVMASCRRVAVRVARDPGIKERLLALAETVGAQAERAA